MNITKKIEKELLFKNNIKEITSISLDSDYKIKDNEINGSFIITGEYKIHEVSVNKEKFNFKIPFNEKINDDIDKETLKIEITDFIYDYRKDELLVNIEYNILGDRKDILSFSDEESLDEFLKTHEVDIVRIDEETEQTEKETTNSELENTTTDDSKIELNTIKQNEVIAIEERNIESEEIIDTLNKPTDKFVTYQVYKISENDTIENIVLKYKVTLDELKEYNDLNNLQINDKIIIPYYE